jgi:hypothetical protein
MGMVSDILDHGVEIGAASRPSWSSWQPLCVPSHAVQTNGFDCGVWVLAQIMALLRGYDCTGLTEVDITAFRFYVSHLLLKADRSSL